MTTYEKKFAESILVSRGTQQGKASSLKSVETRVPSGIENERWGFTRQAGRQVGSTEQRYYMQLPIVCSITQARNT